jgi:hypothetical protein
MLSGDFENKIWRQWGAGITGYGSKYSLHPFTVLLNKPRANDYDRLPNFRLHLLRLDIKMFMVRTIFVILTLDFVYFSTQIRNGNGIQILKTVKSLEILYISTMLLQQLLASKRGSQWWGI